MAKEDIRAFGSNGISYFVWKRTTGSKGFFITRFNKHEKTTVKIEISSTQTKEILGLSDSDAIKAAQMLFRIRIQRVRDEESGIFVKRQAIKG